MDAAGNQTVTQKQPINRPHWETFPGMPYRAASLMSAFGAAGGCPGRERGK